MVTSLSKITILFQCWLIWMIPESGKAFVVPTIKNAPSLFTRSHYESLSISSLGGIVAKSSSDDNDELFGDDMEMQQTIMSLSMESDDDTRRERLKSLFDDKLMQENDDEAATKFVTLFESALTKVGTEIQSMARDRASKKSTETTTKKEEGDKTTKDPSEIQLWALVDMMVQSKTLIKKNKESKSSE